MPERTIQKNSQNGVNKKMGGFFDHKILPINFTGGGSGIGGERKDNYGPQKGGQPILNSLRPGHELILPCHSSQKEVPPAPAPAIIIIQAIKLNGGLDGFSV